MTVKSCVNTGYFLLLPHQIGRYTLLTEISHVLKLKEIDIFKLTREKNISS